MVVELKDTDDTIFHNVFQEWREKHPTGIFLTLETRSKANLHGAACHHLGSTNWSPDPGTGRHSLTRKLKALDNNPDSLNAWAAQRGVAIHLCKHCLRDELIDETFFSATPPAAELAIGSQVQSAQQAVEGLAREVTYLSYGRNAALRQAALFRARGVCEACLVNFAGLMGGLGARVLQVHHREQLALRDAPSVTKVEDLAVVCANCHALIHSDQEFALSVERVRELWQGADSF